MVTDCKAFIYIILADRLREPRSDSLPWERAHSEPLKGDVGPFSQSLGSLLEDPTDQCHPGTVCKVLTAKSRVKEEGKTVIH